MIISIALDARNPLHTDKAPILQLDLSGAEACTYAESCHFKGLDTDTTVYMHESNKIMAESSWQDCKLDPRSQLPVP